jgi:hypothetical protein
MQQSVYIKHGVEANSLGSSIISRLSQVVGLYLFLSAFSIHAASAQWIRQGQELVGADYYDAAARL